MFHGKTPNYSLPKCFLWPQRHLEGEKTGFKMSKNRKNRSLKFDFCGQLVQSAKQVMVSLYNRIAKLSHEQSPTWWRTWRIMWDYLKPTGKDKQECHFWCFICILLQMNASSNSAYMRRPMKWSSDIAKISSAYCRSFEIFAPKRANIYDFAVNFLRTPDLYGLEKPVNNSFLPGLSRAQKTFLALWYTLKISTVKVPRKPNRGHWWLKYYHL